MKKISLALVATLAFAVAGVANAGQFAAHVFGARSQEGASLVAEVVTDKFTSRFPANKWTIVIISSGYVFTNGGGMAHATVGVSPSAKIPSVPIRQYSAYNMVNPGGRTLSLSDVADLERQAIRSATEGLMAACDETKNCDVYKAR